MAPRPGLSHGEDLSIRVYCYAPYTATTMIQFRYMQVLCPFMVQFRAAGILTMLWRGLSAGSALPIPGAEQKYSEDQTKSKPFLYQNTL